MALRILCSIVVWLAYTLIIFVPLFLIGLVLVPLATVCGTYDVTFDPVKYAKGEDPDVYHFTWPFMWLWDNYEDGIANTMYYQSPSFFKVVMKWYFRNPVNNLRLVPYLSCDIHPNKVSFWCSTGDFTFLEPAPATDDFFQPGLMRIMYDFDTKVPQWWFAWQGLYSNFWWQFEMPFTVKIPFTSLGYSEGDLIRFWCGWKLYPTDIYGVTEYRKRGASFAHQFKRIAKVGEW